MQSCFWTWCWCPQADPYTYTYITLVSFRIAAGWWRSPCRHGTCWTRAACSSRRARGRGTEDCHYFRGSCNEVHHNAPPLMKSFANPNNEFRKITLGWHCHHRPVQLCHPAPGVLQPVPGHLQHLLAGVAAALVRLARAHLAFNKN